MNCTSLSKLVFFFPGTVLHELAHYVTALLLGRAEGFSVSPKREGNTYVLGSVRSTTRYRVLSSFIALAPLIWWLVLFLLFRHIHIIGTDGGVPRIHPGVIREKLRSFGLSDALFLWLFLQLLWAGRPSLPDMKHAARGIFSPSGLLLAAALAVVSYLSSHF
ncbi:MAG: hypothetical protein M0Z60_09180 [Nitrospiraceae bacterium]|nr:hypothetical protein [Nitrospiraceae bacterium]